MSAFLLVCSQPSVVWTSVCCARVGNADVSWMNFQGDGGHDDDDLSSLNVQPEYHTGRPTYTCPRCSKQFLYGSQLRQHLRFHLKHRAFRCPVCSKTFVQSSNLVEHFRIHSDERPFACDVCDRRFRQSSNLNYHIRTAHGQSNQSETTTGDVTGLEKSPSAAKRSEPKSFSCEQCGRSFAHACQLTNHARSHTKDRPFQCQYCQKLFSYSSNLSEHIRIHTGERPYICGTCSRSFAQSSQLKVHVKAHHPNSDGSSTLLVICPVCHLRVNGLKALRDHLKLHSSPDSKQSPRSKHSQQSTTKFRPSRQELLQAVKRVTRLRMSTAKRSFLDDRSVKCPYVCCYCTVAFAKQSQLISHIWFHEAASPEPSASYQMNVKIKTEDGNESESSATDVEEPVNVPKTRSQTESNQEGHSSRHAPGQFTCPFCNKRFPHRRTWRMHLKTHKTRRSRGSSKKGLSGKKSSGRDSSLITTPDSDGERGAVEQPGKTREMTAVKVENGNDISRDGDDHPETALDASFDGDDNAEVLDPVPTRRRQQQKESLASASTGKLLAEAAVLRRGRKRPAEKKSKPRATKSRTYPCAECGRVMASAAAMHYHRRTHSGDKPFACSQCPRRFIIRGQLVEHERIHSGEKPFACDQCEKRFAQSSQLRQHASVHSDVATHVCPTCGEAFTRPWRLQSHLRAAHADDSGSQKRYRCDDCGREYSLRQSWVYHRLTHSSDRPFQCDVCSRQFRVAGQLRQHANHCRGRRAQHPIPYRQPPQHWWLSESDTDLLAPTVSHTNPTHVPADTLTPNNSGSSESTTEITGAELHHL